MPSISQFVLRLRIEVANKSGLAILQELLYVQMMVLSYQVGLSLISLIYLEFRVAVSLNQPISILREVCTSNDRIDIEGTGGSEPQLGRPVLPEGRRGKGERNGPLQLRSSTLKLNLCKGNGTLVKLATYINGSHSSKTSPCRPKPHHADSC